FKELISFVLLKIELVEIQVESNVTIYQIFENINDRGLHLSASDKFKNLYCSLLPNEQIDRFEKEWFDISKLVHAMGLDIEHFFDFYFRSNGKDDEGDFYKQFRKDISSKSSKNDKLKETTNAFTGIKDMVKVAQAVTNVKLTDLLDSKSTQSLDRLSKVVGAVVHQGWKTSDQLRVLIYASFFAFKARKDHTAYNSFLMNLMNSVRFYVAATLQGTK